MSEQGSHYKTVAGEQHHERAIRLKLNWYAANITKYAERAPHKGQLVEDLIKVIDYAAMWLSSDDTEVMPGSITRDQEERILKIVEKIIPSGVHWRRPADLPKVKPEHLISDQMEEPTGAYVNQK